MRQLYNYAIKNPANFDGWVDKQKVPQLKRSRV